MAALTKFDIAGKHAIVTGGAQGLSRGMAEGLLEAGCKVVIIDVQKEKVEKVCEEYRAKGLKAYSVIGNLADRADLNRAFDEALQILDGRLDVLVPAAGIQRRYLPEEFPAEQWDLVMKINLDHVWFMIQRSLQVMLKQPTGGKIITIGSIDFPLQRCITEQIDVQFSYSSAGEYPVCLQAIAEGRAGLTGLWQSFPLAEGAKVFDRLVHRDESLTKAILIP